MKAYLQSPMPRRGRPSLDRLIAVLDEHPAGLTRRELGRELRLSYVGVVGVLERAADLGWVVCTVQHRPGLRSVLIYRAQVPSKGGGRGNPPPGGGPSA